MSESVERTPAPEQNAPPGPHPASAAVMLVLLCLALFFSSLGSHDLWAHDEVRYALVAREMRDNHHFLVPYMNDEVLHTAPPLMSWLTVWFAELPPLHGRYEISARLPAAFAGLLTVLLTWVYASRRWDRWTGFVAGLVLATSAQFFWLSRTGTGDALIALGIIITVLCLAEAADRSINRGVWVIGASVGLIVACLSGGLFAVCYGLLSALAFSASLRRMRRVLLSGCGAALLAGLLVALWLFWAREDSGGVYTMPAWPAEHADTRAPWFYGAILLRDWLPWSVFLPVAAWTAVRDRAFRGERHVRRVWAWLLIPLAGLSLVPLKDERWLLPLYPAVAIVLATFFRRYADDLEPLYRRVAIRRPVVFLTTAVACLGVALVAVHWWPPAWRSSLQAFQRPTLFSGVAILAFAGWAVLHHAWRPPSRVIATIAVFATLGYSFSAGVIAPLMDASRSAKPFALYTRALAGVDKRVILFAPFQPDIAYYYGRPLDVEADPNAFLSYEGAAEPIVAILREDAYLQRPPHAWPHDFQKMLTYRIGATGWVILTNRTPTT